MIGLDLIGYVWNGIGLDIGIISFHSVCGPMCVCVYVSVWCIESSS